LFPSSSVIYHARIIFSKTAKAVEKTDIDTIVSYARDRSANALIETSNGTACEALSPVCVVHVDNQRTGSAEEQDYFIPLVRRWIDFAVDGMRRDVEKIARPEGNGILFSGISFKASRSGGEVTIDIVISVVVPARNCARITS
jgi:hypothetical protein